MKNYPLAASSSDQSAYRGLFTSQSADRVRALIDDALSKGATRVIGYDSSSSTTPNVIQPTLLDNTPESAKIIKEEIFGPAVAIIRFADEKEAIRIANAREFGLSAAVFSRDIGRAFKVAKQIEVRYYLALVDAELYSVSAGWCGTYQQFDDS